MTHGNLSSLRAHLADERALAEASRPSGTTDDELDRAIRRVARADAALAGGQVDDASRELAELAQVAGDSWPHSELGAAILGASQALQRRSVGSSTRTTSQPAPGSAADDRPDAEPWPRWIRYTLLAVLVAVVGIGVVVALRANGFLPIAGPFVALFLLPLLAPLRRRGLRSRSRRAERAAHR